MAFFRLFSNFWLVHSGSIIFLVFFYDSPYLYQPNKKKFRKIHQNSEAHDFYENGKGQKHVLAPQGRTVGPKNIFFADSCFPGP